MAQITLSKANTIIKAALAKGAELGLKPLSIAVLDAGGHLKAFQKQDGASMLRFEIAFGKAFGALAVGAGSRSVEKFAKERPHFVEGLVAASGGHVIPVAGGVLVKNAKGDILGAVGITGDTSDNDEAAAIAGIEAAGLVGDGGQG
ncbi:GlcG/HbpS family heme-binding protein [Phyllobacterium lublinensis]|uniref:GlcG/HbpS family heme-binding protein n=1 Tax=Phyllobacterium lublinensis TaxID=2875708 RepID=UPI001CCCCA74|nr:heme-binding protein [Phyllobacterium sp. 2063]MBZ9654489.1 heme-binding protein [Phyllobacterium sp. 2063]